MDIDDDILIQKYETLLYNKESMYFDIEEFDIIISYYVSESRYADALEALIRAELCYPDDIELALHKIRIMMYLDNFDRAFELLLSLEDKSYDLFEINLYKGHIYTLNDEIENAVQEFELALEKNPDFEDVELQYIPNILIDQKYYEEAIPFLHRFIDAGICTAQMFLNIGRCYEQIGEPEKAEKYYEKSLDEDPFNEKTWVTLGILHLNTNNAQKALEAFEFALSINSDSQIVSLCKAAALIQSGEHDKATECIMDVLAKAPDDANALFSLGECYEQTQNLEEAEHCYAKAIMEEYDFAMPYWGLSKLLYAQGDVEAAIRVINKAIELEPDNEEYLYFRGQCFISIISNKDDLLETILQNSYILKEASQEEYQESEFMNKHKKAVFFYNVGDLEACCKYLLESVVINREGFEMFFKLFPKAKDDAYIINYLGKYLK
jgi:tetratricopeptide (TPR) repeat protein